MTAKITIDKAVRRVLIQKPSSENLGDDLSDSLKKEYGIVVYQGEATDLSIPELLDRERENRNFQAIDPAHANRIRTP